MTLILYTLPGCINCQILKEKLKIFGYEYEERPMDSAESITEMRFNGCFATNAPVLQCDDRFYEYHECTHENFFAELMGVCGEKVEVPDIQETHSKL